MNVEKYRKKAEIDENLYSIKKVAHLSSSVRLLVWDLVFFEGGWTGKQTTAKCTEEANNR